MKQDGLENKKKENRGGIGSLKPKCKSLLSGRKRTNRQKRQVRNHVFINRKRKPSARRKSWSK